MAVQPATPILVAGGGVGGLAAALALSRKGIPVKVFERHATAVAERGTALNIWGNAITALDHLGVADAVREHGFPLERTELYSWRGSRLSAVPVAAVGRELGTESVNVLRSDLQQILYDALDPDTVQLGSECAGYRVEGDRVVLLTADGGEVAGAALVGADGARSTVRAQLLADGEPTVHGHPIWRGISDGDAGLEPGVVRVAFGNRGQGAGCWHVAKDQVSWTVGINTAFHRRHGDSPADPKAALLDYLADLSGPMPELVRLTPPERISATTLLIHTDASTWGAGPVTLLGDAQHAMPTVFGQGACQAVEDAVVLGEQLGEQLAASSEVVPGLRGYERRREERLEWVRDRVFTFDRFQRWENPIKCAVRNTMIRLSPVKSSIETNRRLLSFSP